MSGLRKTDCRSPNIACSDVAQFDVHQLGNGLVIDCQSDLLKHIVTRFVVPLVPPRDAAVATHRLNPQFEIEDKDYILVTQAAATVERNQLGPVVTSLADHSYEITGAIDVLTGGV